VLSRGAASAEASNYQCPSRGAGGCSTQLAGQPLLGRQFLERFKIASPDIACLTL